MKNIMLFAMLIFLFSNCNSLKKSAKMGLPVRLTDHNFQEKVLDNKKVSVVYFWATWCGPCEITSPTIDHLSKEQRKYANFGKVNVDKCPKITSEYSVVSLPTVLIIKNGEVVDQNVGGFSSSIIRGMIKEHAQPLF